MLNALPMRPTPRVARWIRATVVVPVILLASASPVPAQPISPQGGGPLPAWFEQARQRDPSAYTFRRGYIQQVERLRQNRRLMEQGLLRPRGGPEEVAQLTTVAGSRSVPIFLGKFSNTGASPITAASLQTELFDGPWPTGTMVDYYDEISYGNLQLQGTVYDWVTVSNNDTYYEGNSNGGLPGTAKTGEFITEILTARDGAVNFGQYDNDGPDGMPNSGDDDGYVDFVGFVHPEIGAECSTVPAAAANIWSHRWVLAAWPQGVFTTNDARFGGGFIRIDDYVIMPALSCNGTMIEIGVFCHEFGHAFGLPDLYDTNGGSQGVGHWCLMGAGNWNTPTRPAHMSAWSKAFLGWITPGIVNANLLNWPILSSTVSPTAFKLWTNGTPGSEYFLVENRTKEGFDDQLWKAGLLVWHVDDNAGSLLLNNVNADETHKRLDLECADQTGVDHTTNADHLDSGANRGDAGDPLCDGDSFTPASNPSSVAYNGSPTDVQITGIMGCGNREVRANLIVNVDQGPLADLCMRDCGSDVCSEPSPCPKFWASPEVYIDNNLDGIIDPPAEGLANNLIARVRNIGGSSASNVNVGFYMADPAMGLLFPSTGTLIDNANVPLIAASGGSETAMVTWNIPLPPPSISHYCLGVIATNADDGQISEYAPNDDNVVQINIQELYAKAGSAVPPGPALVASAVPDALRKSGPASAVRLTDEIQEVFTREMVVQVCNPGLRPCQFEIRLGSPPSYDDVLIPPDWIVELEYTSIFLNEGECRPLRVQVTDPTPVHTDSASVPLTLLCANQAVGGVVMSFEIDNVQPPDPCTGFTAVQTPPFGSDNNPGAGLIRVSWPDAFTDVLGFPERVERWRLYRMSDPATPPDPAHLLIETCRDEDPSTPLYDHFADAPSDPTEVWYKIVAVDRAGNESGVCLTQVSGPAPGTPTLEFGFPLALASGAVSPPAICQIDGDDDSEIVFGDAAGNIQAYNHDGSVVPGWPVNVGGIPPDSPVAVGDLDGDGHHEVVCGNTTGRVWALRGDGTAFPGWPIVLGTNAATYACIGSLLPGPARQVVALSGTQVHLRNADGTSVIPFPLVTNTPMSAGAAIGDVDADGDREIVILQQAGMDVITAAGDVQAFRFPPGASFAAAPSLADLNLDGDLEIVAPSQQGVLYVWHPDGTDFPGWPYTEPLGVPLTTVALANARAGFEPELVFGVRSATSPRVHAFYHDGTELGGYPQSTGPGWFLFGAPIADILDEGSSDLVVGARDAFGHAWDNFGSPLPNWPVELGFGARCHVSPASGDIDQDGNVEVVFVTTENPSLVIFDLNAQVQRGPSVRDWYWPMFGYNPQRTHCLACGTDAVVDVGPEAGTPAQLALRPAWPNPASGRQTLRFELPQRVRARLAIYDVAGRQVRLLVDSELPAGVHAVAWDGTGRDGARVAPGVYYSRLMVFGASGMEQRTGKLVLVD